jgi:AraC family transcriptional regulator of adaptative response/methylated-DNA-[protein]-cysteine methyltransferase
MNSQTNQFSAVTHFRDESTRWEAVLRRDSHADGHFFYSVRTTGVYCRPSCASRPARRENVSFHETGADAERAGFRPCQRCKPREPGLGERRARAVEAACRMIENSDSMPTLDALAKASGMSRFHFHRVFRSVTGVTPSAYAATHRAERVRAELSRRPTVTEAIYESGFNSSGRFYGSASARLGMTPSRFKSGGHGTSIHFAIGRSSLGNVLVGATDRGVCAIFLGDDRDSLVEDLKRRFPAAQLIPGDDTFKKTVAAVVNLVETPAAGFDLPLDVRGTAFQQRVWQALRKIPAGLTATYADVAKNIGAPQAVRAVAGACAANPVAVVVPCHRVVRSDGSLSGYRWGVKRKRALLDREAARGHETTRRGSVHRTNQSAERLDSPHSSHQR